MCDSKAVHFHAEVSRTVITLHMFSEYHRLFLKPWRCAFHLSCTCVVEECCDILLFQCRAVARRLAIAEKSREALTEELKLANANITRLQVLQLFLVLNFPWKFMSRWSWAYALLFRMNSAPQREVMKISWAWWVIICAVWTTRWANREKRSTRSNSPPRSDDSLLVLCKCHSRGRTHFSTCAQAHGDEFSMKHDMFLLQMDFCTIQTLCFSRLEYVCTASHLQVTACSSDPKTISFEKVFEIVLLFCFCIFCCCM